MLIINITDTSRVGSFLTFLKFCSKQIQGVYSERIRFELDSNRGRELLKMLAQNFLLPELLGLHTY
jgi:hypothetical protein